MQKQGEGGNGGEKRRVGDESNGRDCMDRDGPSQTNVRPLIL